MKKILSVFFLACCSCIVMAQDNVIDEIVWVVGDDAILRSDIETQRLYNQNEGVRLDGDPYCVCLLYTSGREGYFCINADGGR